jgi:RNA polymerase sigma-70 factor (ECF subfamily)
MEHELEVIQKALTGDQDSYTWLYNQNSTKIFSLLMKLTHNPDISEDLMQDTFLKGFNKLSSFKGDSKFYSWLYCIAKREFLMSMRQYGRIKFELTSISLDDNYGNDHPLQNMFGCEDKNQTYIPERMQLNKALKQLSATDKKVFILYHLHGMHHTEIGNILHLTRSAVKARNNRAKVELRSML